MTAPEDFRIERLSEHLDAIPTLVQWFDREWEPWYGENGMGDAEQDLHESARPDRLPLALVALNSRNDVLGTAALKEKSAGDDTAPGPWLAAMVVGSPFRRQGIGSALVEAVEREAARLGYDQLFTSTDTLVRLLSARGWLSFGKTDTLRGTVKIYRLGLGPVKV